MGDRSGPPSSFVPLSDRPLHRCEFYGLRYPPRALILARLDSGIRPLIRQKIIAGVLPGDPPLRVWAGMGNGRRCGACEEVIKGNETEMELELSGARQSVRLHRGCFTIWREECDHG